MKRLLRATVIFVILFSLSCCSGFGRKYRVAVDPTFYPAALGGQADNVYGFTIDLIKEISRTESIQITYLSAGSESILSGLQRNIYDGVISPKYNVAIESNIYSLSNNFFQTGPVMVVPVKSKLNEFKQMQNKIIGVVENSDASDFAGKYPSAFIYTYVNPALVMEALKYNLVDVAFLDIMVARAFVSNLYQGIFEISTSPMSDEGLYLVTMHKEHPGLIDAFNRGLKRAKRNGTYKKLMKKWNLNA